MRICTRAAVTQNRRKPAVQREGHSGPRGALGCACLFLYLFHGLSREDWGSQQSPRGPHPNPNMGPRDPQLQPRPPPSRSPYLWFPRPNSLELVSGGKPGVKQGPDVSHVSLRPSSWLRIPPAPPPETAVTGSCCTDGFCQGRARHLRASPTAAKSSAIPPWWQQMFLFSVDMYPRSEREMETETDTERQSETETQGPARRETEKHTHTHRGACRS